MVAKQSKMAISKITTQNTELKHTHINLAVLIRHSLKYKNTACQKISYIDTGKISKGGKEARLKEEGGGGGRGGAKEVALQTSPATCRYPGVMGLYPGPPEKGGLELGPTRNNSSFLPRGGDLSPILSLG